MAEIAGAMVLVEYKNRECVVASRGKGDGEWYVWVAPEGRAPYGDPSRGPYGTYWFNARAREDGTLEEIN